jgi:hypothetical protein
VRAVDDQMRARPVGADHRADAMTEAAVLDALILDDAVPAYDVDVDVGQGDAVRSRRHRVPARGRRTDRPTGPRCIRGGQPAEGVVTVYANRAGLELWGSARLSWLREVMSSLVKELLARLDSALAGALSGRRQLTFRTAGEALHVHAPEHLERGAEVLAGVQAAPLATQPFRVHELRAGEVHA